MGEEKKKDLVIGLAGNPNVGKSTVFNQLTGLKQHTGNWPGKTVVNAKGYCNYNNQRYVLIDIPGCYSLMAHSAEEEVARNFICFENPDAVVVVCDATCLERNMSLALQIIEVTSNVIICVNLMDEARKKEIHINLDLLEKRLGVPVVGTIARSNVGIEEIFEKLKILQEENNREAFRIKYDEKIEEYIEILEPIVKKNCKEFCNSRWLSSRLLDADGSLLQAINEYLNYNIMKQEEVLNGIFQVRSEMEKAHLSKEQLRDKIAEGFVREAEEVCKDAIEYRNEKYDKSDRYLDRLFTSKITGFPIMFLVLMVIFWLTIIGANYPSQLINTGLFWIEDRLVEFFQWTGAPEWFYSVLVYGIYRVVAWVISVMLPPMAIFFPLFTLLEDFGYLPRIAFNLDRCFKKCCACGKQALTMCMGFGCNAVGVIGCRIIDSPRERLVAIITNSFVPCNGRFPTLITIITMFFIGNSLGIKASIFCAGLLAGIIVLGILMTLIASKILTKTVLKGVPSSFALELPPYRRPQVGKVIIRSIFDRTLFVLGRAVAVAAPVGLIIWLMANITIGNETILAQCAGWLDPFGRILGMDGVILLAFILGMPANEIVVPIIIMSYLAEGSLMEISDLTVLKQLLVQNGWTWITAVSTMLFLLMHWPCSTTCITIKKETQSIKWAIVSFLLPTVTGIIVCFLFTSAAKYMIGI